MTHRCESLRLEDFKPCPYCGEKPRWGCYKMALCRIAVLCITPCCKASAFNETGTEGGSAVYAEDAVASWNAWATKTAKLRQREEVAKLNPRELIEELARAGGGEVVEIAELTDGSGFTTARFPLPADHWLTQPSGGVNVPPMGLRCGTADPRREVLAEKIRAAAQYAVRCATMNGRERDFDPDALVQSMVVGLLGYWTSDGLSSEDWGNPPDPPRLQAPT